MGFEKMQAWTRSAAILECCRSWMQDCVIAVQLTIQNEVLGLGDVLMLGTKQNRNVMFFDSKRRTRVLFLEFWV